MNCSGRRNPCPVCGRDKDDKCRWNDEIILCWQGDSFSPPENLRPGQTLDVPGRGCMAVLAINAGTAGSSVLFGPHDGTWRPVATGVEPDRYWEWRGEAMPVAKKLRAALKILRNTPDFIFLKISDLKKLEAGLKLCGIYVTKLDNSLEKLPIKHPKAKQMRKLLLDSRRQIQFFSQSFYSFKNNDLSESRARREASQPVSYRQN